MVAVSRITRQEPPETSGLLDQLHRISRPLHRADTLEVLIRRLAEARYVLLGEASHGTSEYYTWRSTISQRLIKEHGFSFIAVEGDWPDCYQVNRYVKGDPNA